ncbi:MAG: Fe-S-containing hydro-lyase [Bacillota bacterium]|nr:Fe-S-containing hydro-lyase [Bacillota bacterium]
MINISSPFTLDDAKKLHAGDNVSISGDIYTGRDAAHKKMTELLSEGKKLPFDVKDQIIYYVGPCPCPPDKIIGSCGPTTSCRMDAYSPILLKEGLRGMIGKGYRSEEVINAMKEYGGVYFCATGGLGALISRSVVKKELVAFPELGTEAIFKLTVKDFPAVVAIDSWGNNLYNIGITKYRR